MAWFETEKEIDPVTTAILGKMEFHKKERNSFEDEINEISDENREYKNKMLENDNRMGDLGELIRRKDIAIANLQKSLLIANSDKKE